MLLKEQYLSDMRDNREGKSDVWTERNNTPKSNKVIIPLIKNTKFLKKVT